MKKLILIMCFMIPLFALSQSSTNTYTIKISTINTEMDLKSNKVELQELMGISDDMEFSSGNIILKSSSNFNTTELKYKLNSNGFMVVGDITKNIILKESTQ